MAKYEIRSETAGTVTQISVSVGANVSVDDSVAVVEVMKMELPVPATAAGTVVSIHVSEGSAINEGDLIAVVEKSG